MSKKYNALRALVKGFLRFNFRLRYYGKENIADTPKGFLAISNHVSGFDAITLHCIAEDKIHLMAKAELFENGFLKKLITSLGAFPVKRGMSDTSAMRTALSLLKEGHTVGIFPEGTRSKTGEMLPFLAGAVMIAQRAKVPVVPVKIVGRYRLFGKTSVYIGKPYDLAQVIDASLPKRGQMEAAQNYMFQSVASLGSGAVDSEKGEP